MDTKASGRHESRRKPVDNDETEEEEEEEEEDNDDDSVRPSKGVKIFVEQPTKATVEPAVSNNSKLKLDSNDRNIMVVEKRDVEVTPLIQVDCVGSADHHRLVETLVREAIDSAEESLSRESSPAEDVEDEQQFRTPPSSFCRSDESLSSQQHSPQNHHHQQLTTTGLYSNGHIATGNYQNQRVGVQGPTPLTDIQQIPIQQPSPSANNQLLLKIKEDNDHSIPVDKLSDITLDSSGTAPAHQNGITHPKPAPRIHVQQNKPQHLESPVIVNVVSNAVDENMNKQISLENINRQTSFDAAGDSSKFSTKPKSESSWILQDSVTATRVSKGAPWAGKGLGTKKIWQVDEHVHAPQLLVTTSLAPARSEPNLNNSQQATTENFMPQPQPVFAPVNRPPPQMQNGATLQSQNVIMPPQRPPAAAAAAVQAPNFGQGAIASLAQLPPKPPANQLYINTESSMTGTTTPWSQRQWKSVSAPNSNIIPTWNQQHQQQNAEQTTIHQKGSFSPSIKKAWAPVQSPQAEYPPSQFPQSPTPPLIAQPSPKQQLMVSSPEMEKVSTAKTPPPVLPKPKANVVLQQQQEQQKQQNQPQQNFYSQPQQQQQQQKPAEVTSMQTLMENQQPLTGISLARAQFESPENQKPMRPMLYRPGNQWPPPKSEATVRSETTPPRQLVQNVNLTPDTKMWTLAKPEQSEIKAQLENVIKSPGIKSSLRNRSLDVEPEEFPVLRKVEQKSASPQQPSPQQQSNQGGDDEEVEHLLKPSEIKANQPKIEDVVGSGSSLSRSPKNATKEALLNQYNAVWDKADNYEEPEVIKCGLPPTKRPVEPENTTDVEGCIKRLVQNDPNLTEVNLNNMKRTPIPQIQRLIDALHNNTYLKKLSLANLGLTDNALEPLLELIEHNPHLETLNIETNFLTGDFLVRLFQSCLKLQSLRDIKAVNQSPTFSNQSELNMMKAIHQNRGVWKVSLNLRLPEARQKVDQALIRNGELRRLKRKIEAMEAEQEYVEVE